MDRHFYFPLPSSWNQLHPILSLIPDSRGWRWRLVHRFLIIDLKCWWGPVQGFLGGQMQQRWRRWGRCLQQGGNGDGWDLKCFWVGPVGAPLSRHCRTSVTPLSLLCHANVAPLSCHFNIIQRVHNGMLGWGLNIFYLYQQWSFIFYFRKKIMK